MRKKHQWHCGHCKSDLHVTKAKKGTKYLFCPNCDRQVAYYNKGLLGKVGKGLTSGVVDLLPQSAKNKVLDVVDYVPGASMLTTAKRTTDQAFNSSNSSASVKNVRQTRDTSQTPWWYKEAMRSRN